MARRKAEPKIKPVMALNTAGHLSMCTSPPEKRGQGRCNHIAHMHEDETKQEFMIRANKVLEDLEGERPDALAGRKPVFDYPVNENGEMQNIEFETFPYRMTEKEKEEGIEIIGRLQLDENLEDKKLFIHFEEPLWNDTDINYYAQLTNERPRNIRDVILGEAEVVVESTDPDFPPGSILTPFRTKKIKELQEEEGRSDIVFGTGVEAMNKAAAYNDFTATTDASVIPYNMRPSSDVVDHPLTVSYKYLLNRRRNPQNQQLAYMALLDNRSLDKDLQRYSDGWTQPSLSDEFAGKSGVFRKYMSGRAVPYAGRAIIDPTTDVDYGEIKIPAAMAVDIYRPTLVKQFIAEGKDDEEFEEFVSQFRENKVTDLQRQELENRLNQGQVRVLMNRQPSSHFGNLQSFKPKISKGNACMIHPMYDEAYGADHDGDPVTLVGINNKEISKISDRSLGARLDINVQRPRKQDEKQVLPQKDSLYGLLSILKQRSN